LATPIHQQPNGRLLRMLVQGMQKMEMKWMKSDGRTCNLHETYYLCEPALAAVEI
jgi:hypothetical protein